MKLWWLLAVVACSKHREPPAMDKARAAALFDEIVIATPPGMSGLALDESSHLLAIAERDRTIVEIDLGLPLSVDEALLQGSGAAVGSAAPVNRTPVLVSHPLSGVPADHDTEGLAYLGNGKFAIAVEGAKSPNASVLFAELRGNDIAVTRTRELTSKELGVELTVNHGAEGICGHGDDVLVAIEPVGTEGGRYGAVARLRGDQLDVYKIRLTTDKGKLASLDCTITADGYAHVWAIERHYGVCRILRFDLPPAASDVSPSIWLDLHPVLHDALNLEGIVQLPDGRVVAINDNQGRTATGPTELLVFHPR